jgi:hypothetical protein
LDEIASTIAEISAGSGCYFGYQVAATFSATSTPTLNRPIYQEVGTSLRPSKAGGTLLALLQVAMKIRIDIESEGPDVVLHVAGRLTGPAIKQLADVGESLETQYVLDLSNLMFADDAGAEVIRALCEGGAEIRGASTFIKLLINSEAG